MIEIPNPTSSFNPQCILCFCLVATADKAMKNPRNYVIST